MKILFYSLILLFVGLGSLNELPHPEPLPTSFAEMEQQGLYNVPDFLTVNDFGAARVYGLLGLNFKSGNGHTCSTCHANEKAGYPDKKMPVGLAGPIDVFLRKINPNHRVDQPTRPPGSFVNCFAFTNALKAGEAGRGGINASIQNDKLDAFNADAPAGLDGINVQPYKAAGEKAHDSGVMVKEMRGTAFYNELAKKSFKGQSYVTAENLNAAMAIAEKSFVAFNAPYQRLRRGEIELDDFRWKKGMELFFEKGCIDCHTGQAFGGTVRAKKIVKSDDHGLFNVTKDSSHFDLFLATQLYNLKDSPTRTHCQNCGIKTTQKAIKAHDTPTTYAERRALAGFIDHGLYDKNCGNRTVQLILNECDEMVEKYDMDVEALFNN